jgi:hypothetical protein
VDCVLGSCYSTTNLTAFPWLYFCRRNQFANCFGRSLTYWKFQDSSFKLSSFKFTTDAIIFNSYLKHFDTQAFMDVYRIFDLKSISFPHDKCGLENSPSILEGVPEGRGSNIKDWPIGHP